MKIKNKRKILSLIICIFVILLTVVVFAGVTVNVENRFYNKLEKFMNPTLTEIEILITNIGSSIFIGIFCLILLLVKKTRFKVGITTSVTVSVAYIVNIILKNIFERQRPTINQIVEETGYSFPSGHSMVNAALYTMLILIIHRNIENKKIKRLLIFICMLVPILVGFSRIYLGVHYLTDVLVGLLIGSLIAILIDIVVERIYDKSVKMLNKSDE